VVVEGRAEAGHVEALLLGVALEVSALEVLLVFEEGVVHAPEARVAALREGLATRLGGGHRLVVEGEGVIAPDEADAVAVALADLRDLRPDARAEGALVVRDVLDHDDAASVRETVHGDGFEVVVGVEAREQVCAVEDGAALEFLRIVDPDVERIAQRLERGDMDIHRPCPDRTAPGERDDCMPFTRQKRPEHKV
jgi:hypothetical protein